MHEISKKVNLSKVSSIPFNSTNKYSATQVKGDYNYTLIKGAPEKILQRCKYYFDENGNKVEFSTAKQLDDKINQFAERAIRMLALAVSEDALGEDALPEGTNIFMFVPYGILLPMVFQKLRKWWKTAVIIFVSTFLIEFVQYFIGRSCDIDDIIMNFIGGCIGYGLYLLLNTLCKEKIWYKNMVR